MGTSKWARPILAQNKSLSLIILGNNRLMKQLDIGLLSPLGEGFYVIHYESMVRNLGVIPDSKLPFHRHIASVTSEANGVLFKLQQLRDFTDVRLRKSLVAALILSYIDYFSH